MESFSVASRFPARRRVTQACVACRTRKTRCDAAQPRCGFCEQHNIHCVYRDSQQPRIDYNTQVLLERIQLLEDRLTTTPIGGGGGGPPVQTPPQQTATSFLAVDEQDNGGAQMDLDVQIPLSHTANANHVFSWPLVRQLLLDVMPPSEITGTDATDVFFEDQHQPIHTHTIPPTWRLDTHSERDVCRQQELIDLYFSEVNTFFPLLSASDIRRLHDAVVVEGAKPDSLPTAAVAVAEHALLLLVLCMSLMMAEGRNLVNLDQPERRPVNAGLEELWLKAKLLLGALTPELSLRAAQCTMLASLFSGARGKVAESFHWAHAAAVKCEALARRYTRGGGSAVPEEFCRLFWIAFIYEGDFVSEIAVTLPSGIARYEDLIPYPTLRAVDSGEASHPAVVQQEELVAFQITTNASIRRFLNRVNSAVYNAKEQQRQQQDHGADHATWLLRVAHDLWSHHAAVYRNLPGFLLTSATDIQHQPSPAADSPTARIEGLMPRGNNPWNILRLKGRYYAGQYIIHRPFVEYALLNEHRFEAHPCQTQILSGCKMCFDGCMGFIRVFDSDPANSITCLFAGGMVTFTMTMILMVATVSPLFQETLPVDVEESISAGIRNLRRFSGSVEEFSWHLHILDRLDTSRKARLYSTRS